MHKVRKFIPSSIVKTMKFKVRKFMPSSIAKMKFLHTINEMLWIPKYEKDI